MKLNFFRKVIFEPKYKDNYLTVVNLTKKYKRNSIPTINNINFHVKKGEFHAFIGGNGAGKTTTIKSIVGAYVKYSGSIYFSGYINTSLEAKRTLGYIPEIARFPENTSTHSYLMSMAQLSELSKNKAKKVVDKILIDLNMQKLAKKSPNSFSSGQKKKILLAQALIHDPKILIMDEPAANLDPKSRIEFFDTLKRLQLQGKSIFISSHILNEIDKYATHATILDGGKIVFSKKLGDYRKNSSRTIKIKVDNNELCEKILIQKNISFSFNKNENYFLLNYDKKLDTNELLIDLINNKIIVNTFQKDISSLEQIYYDYVIKGSVHTMN